MKKYEKFNENELKEILTTSNSYDEALIKLGYVANSSNRAIIKQIALQYNIDITHFINKQTKNLIGEKFNRLLVIKKVPSKRNGARWLCQCDCGNLKEVDSNHLTRGNIISCGCYNHEQTIKYNKEKKIQDLTGKKFGKLTVLYRGENIGEQTTWICQCECGNITHPIMSGNLKAGTTKSCGCLVSQGELKIRQILNENNIIFNTQVSFSDCLSEKKSQLRFDFGVYDNKNNLLYLIEYQGVQHYQEVFWTRDTLKDRQERDNIKKKYCEEKNIPLIIIPHTKFSTLNINDLTIKKE